MIAYKNYVGIVMQHQFFKNSYIVSNEFVIGLDPTMDCEVSCPLPNEKIFYLLENYLKILACSQVSDRCPLGYLSEKL